ncbi:MAG: glycosyltransferase [Candidatus Nanohaloarchaea archaeon]
MEKLEVSVILPVHNPRGDWIRSSVESVFNQKYGNWELVIVDDNSPVPPREVLPEEQMTDDRVSVHRRMENGGFTAATNTAIEESNGKYIAPIGQDDLWRAGKLEKQVSAIEGEGADAVFTRTAVIDSEGEEVRVDGVFPDHNRLDELFMHPYPCYESALYRSRVFERYGNLDESYDIASDWEFWLRVFPDISIVYLDDTLTMKRTHPGAKSTDLQTRVEEDGRLLRTYLDRYDIGSDLRRRALTNHYRKKGKRLYEEGKRRDARNLWMQSFSSYPSDVLSLFLLMVSVNPYLYIIVDRLYSKLLAD